MPKEGEFEVKEGKLVSKLGDIEKRATFGSWAYVYSGPDKKKVVGWGPCLTSGEVLVPHIFVAGPPRDELVENSFLAEDFGTAYTLIKLDSSQKHRLCVLYRPPQPKGIMMIGRMGLSGKAEVGGKCTISEKEDSFFVSTATYVGTTAAIGGASLYRKIDRWYGGEKKLGEKP